MTGNQGVAAKQPEATIEIKHPDGSEETVTEKVGDPVLFTDPPCNVGYSFGFTESMGDYKSVRAQVTLHIPCTADEIDDVFELARTWVNERVEEVYEDVVTAKKGE